MGGIEVLAATVIFIIGVVGLIRGPAKELGVTMALMVVLAVMSQFDALVEFEQLPAKVNNVMAGLSLDTSDPVKQSLVVLFFYTAGIVVTSFLAYHGQDTLKFSFKDPSPPGGAILGWLVGALNGYLMFGTFWYYLDRLGYPIQRYVWFQLPLTTLGQDMVGLLPQNVAGGLVMSGLALILLWWKILR